MKAPADQKEVLELFTQGPTILEKSLAGLSNNELDYIPANGSWSIRQIVHHVTDGDDIWKMFIKIALGNENAEFDLNWYWTHPQTEWTKFWNYENRTIEASTDLLRANRMQVVELLGCVENVWNNSLQFRKHDKNIEKISIGAAVKIQADHLVHHVKRIEEIREEYSKK